MAVIQNIFKNLEYKLTMTDEIKLFKWSQKTIQEKLATLMDWNEEFTPESVLVKAAEQILELNYPNEYMKYAAMQQKFTHTQPFYIESQLHDVSSFIEWINGVFDRFEGLQEGLLGGLVVSPTVEGSMISCEYDKGKLTRVLNQGDGEDAELLVNLMDQASIPQDISVKKSVLVRGMITLKDSSKKTKGQTTTAAVNEIMFADDIDDSNLVFIPHEWLSKGGEFMNTTKVHQLLKDNGFVTIASHKAAQVMEALSTYEEYLETDFGIDTIGCRIEVENSETINSLMEQVRDDNLSEYLHKIILLGE